MSGDPSGARPGGGFRTSSGGLDGSGRMERAERTDVTDPGLSAALGPSGRPAVKDPLPRPPSSGGRPTEVYDQVRREWVTVGGAAVAEPAPAEPPPPPIDSGAVVTAVPQAGAGVARKARLVLTTVDPWSVMKISFVLSLAGAIILLVTVWLMWLLLSNGGVFTSVDHTVGDIAGSTSSISVLDIFSLRRVMGVALMLAVIQVVLVTALATLGAFLYNLASGLVGGLDVTFAEDR